jgi:TolB protein
VAVRILLVLAVLAIFYGCGQSGSGPRQDENEGGIEPKNATPSGAGAQATTLQQSPATSNEPTTDATSAALTDGCLGHGRTVGGQPRYSPNGQQIAFETGFIRGASVSASPSAAADRDSEICMVNADGTGMTNLTNNSRRDEYSPVWSPDGKKIAFATYRYKEAGPQTPIVIMNADGSGEIELTGTEEAVSGMPQTLDWSPDGEDIVFVAPCGLYVKRADGSGAPRKLVSGEAKENRCPTAPAWAPNGKEIAFVKAGNLYVMNVRGEGGKLHMQKLIDDRAEPVNYPAWSPDGTEVAFNNGGFTIYKADTDNSKATSLAPGFAPTWSPDGEHIAYTAYSDSAATGPLKLYVMNPDGSHSTLLVPSG